MVLQRNTRSMHWYTLLKSLLAPSVCVCVVLTQTTNISQPIVADSVAMYQPAGTYWCKGVPMCYKMYQCAAEERTRCTNVSGARIRGRKKGQCTPVKIFSLKISPFSGRGTLEKIHSCFIFVLTTHTSRHLIPYQPFPTLPCLTSQKEIPGIPL